MDCVREIICDDRIKRLRLCIFTWQGCIGACGVLLAVSGLIFLRFSLDVSRTEYTTLYSADKDVPTDFSINNQTIN